ncbi:hypothetical protein HF1_05510 [Mycoplasma haemofelis str. Langford 1]|uniref:Uncharacterized protein n=1 Tax=Mycoplasma haemofelis (strain Langford 1) TaxID=941640 RepID=E8ZHD8_MYCHL|nr:hypothetical protein [Mycoplasma haemofelis]CBY92559.1 hypothetical protein HF1_05510 [Mycoplasma haemofelis str. Langford 1]
MSSSIAKSITTSAAVAVVSGVGFKSVESIFKYPTNKDHLESQGYKSLFEVKRNQFTRWKERFLRHKEELMKMIPEIHSNSSNNEGAYFLKKWCYQNIYKGHSSSNKTIFNQIKSFCTIDIKSFLLEGENVQTIDDVQENKEEAFKQRQASIIKVGILKQGSGFSKSVLFETYHPITMKIINNAKEFCLAPEPSLMKAH